MKKLAYFLLSLLMVFALASCKGNDTTTTKELTDVTLNTEKVAKEFYIGDEFSSSGLEVIATYSDASTENVTSSCTVDDDAFDSAYPGMYEIKVYYQGQTTFKQLSYEVEVKEIIPELPTPYIVGLILTSPTKTEYKATETLDLAGLSATVVLSNMTTKSVTLDECTVDTSNIDMNNPNDYYEIVVSYSEKYEHNGKSQTLTVKNSVLISVTDKLVGIEVNTNNAADVEQYLELDYSAWIITGKYESNIDRPVSVENIEVEYDTNEVGEATATITYSEKGVTVSTTATINVTPTTFETEVYHFYTADDLSVGDIDSNLVWNPSALTATANTASIVTILAGGGTGENVTVDGNAKTFDKDVKFTQRVKLNGEGKTTSRAIQIDLSEYEGKIIKLKIYTLSGSSSANRALNICEGSYNKTDYVYQVPAPGSSTSSYEVQLEGGKVYTLASTGSGVNVYGLEFSIGYFKD